MKSPNINLPRKVITKEKSSTFLMEELKESKKLNLKGEAVLKSEPIGKAQQGEKFKTIDQQKL